MIDQKSIDNLISSLEIKDVVSRYVDIKKRGSTWTGCCPFHDEKTASFTVSEAKQIFKCFGCGEGGDAVAFVMKKEGMDFIPAIKLLASWYNFALEEIDADPEERENAKKKVELWKINAAAARVFVTHRLALPDAGHWVPDELYLRRKFEQGTLLDFQVGYALDEWRNLVDLVTPLNLYFPAEQLGLVKSNAEGKTFDVFRNRIMFPICDENGQIVGFGGRKDPADEAKDNPKYLNSKESLLYKKERVLYGLHLAKNHIKKAGYATLVEGYTDVLSMHQGGCKNTVGTCGTALTTHHAKLLKRYTSTVVIMNDGDKAGQKATLKSIDILIAEGLQVKVCPLPEDDDPDTFARRYFKETEAK